MSNRREFLKEVASASAGLVFMSRGIANAANPAYEADVTRGRWEVKVGSRRVRTVDVHSHCYLPEVWDMVKDQDKGTNPFNIPGRGDLVNLYKVDTRLAQMDQRGIDMAIPSFNPPNWYSADRDLADRIVRLQNEKLAELCRDRPDRFRGFASVAMQYPDMAAQQLEYAVKKLGMRGTLIGGSINGMELSNPNFHPFWAKAEELQALVFIHSQGFPEGESRFKGNGRLQDVIGNPFEMTTALSHLIFDGTLDRFPKVKICAAHGGGYLPFYTGRSDRILQVDPDHIKPFKKLPSEYLRHLYYDTTIYDVESMRHLIATVGASQIVFGSGAPGKWGEDAVDFILQVPGLTDSERKGILGENLEKLLEIA